jgi:hypothetical protein
MFAAYVQWMMTVVSDAATVRVPLTLPKHQYTELRVFSVLSVVSFTRRSVLCERCFDLLNCVMAMIASLLDFEPSIR